LALFLLLLLGACSSVRPWQNQPLNATAARKPAMPMATTADERSMLMFSQSLGRRAGGARAAAFGYGVLDALRQTRVEDRSSGRSGGGARAAAFGYGVLDALQQTRVQWRGEATSLLDARCDQRRVGRQHHCGNVLRGVWGADLSSVLSSSFCGRTFRTALISNMLRPGNLYDLSSPWFGRSNLLERRLAELYRGKTFGDLVDRPGLPRLLVSATDLSLGTSFEFTWRQFSLICSDLGSVPLSFAVAASSAVPIALSPMALKNHNSTCLQPIDLASSGSADYRVRLLRDSQRSYLDAEGRPFIHLVDGGLADNLGLRSLLDRSQADGGIRGSVRKVSSCQNSEAGDHCRQCRTRPDRAH
jgi:NTE family protein